MITSTPSLQSTANTVQISSTNFDTLISKYHPKANINFVISDLDIKMDIMFEMNPKTDRIKNSNEIILSINFYHKDKEIEYSEIYQSQLVELVTAYNQYVTNLLNKNIHNQKKHLSFNLSSVP